MRGGVGETWKPRAQADCWLIEPRADSTRVMISCERSLS